MCLTKTTCLLWQRCLHCSPQKNGPCLDQRSAAPLYWAMCFWTGPVFGPVHCWLHWAAYVAQLWQCMGVFSLECTRFFASGCWWVWDRLVWNVSWSFSKTPEMSGMTIWFCFSVSSPTFRCLWSLQVQSQSEGGGGSWWLPTQLVVQRMVWVKKQVLCVCWVPVYFDDEASIRTDVNCAV